MSSLQNQSQLIKKYFPFDCCISTIISKMLAFFFPVEMLARQSADFILRTLISFKIRILILNYVY